VADVDALGRPLATCGFWSCSETFPASRGRRFCSRGCKQADSRRRSRKADRTREKRRAAGKEEGYEDGHLYMIAPIGDPVVKVGYSKSVKERLRVLQTAHYRPLELVASIETRRYLKNDPPDKAIHELLDDEDHVKGEWWITSEHTRSVLREVGFEFADEDLS